LSRRNDAAFGVYRQLLNSPVDWSGQKLEFCPLFGLEQIAGESGSLTLRFGQLAKQLAMKLCRCLSTILNDCSHRSFGFLKPTFLDRGIAFIFSELLNCFQVSNSRS
jgi:hypothetical protein